MNIRKDLTQSEKQFIRDHFEKVPVRELAARMKRGAKIIYDFVKAENLVVTDGTRRSTRSHPWRKANRGLWVSRFENKDEESKPRKKCGRDRR